MKRRVLLFFALFYVIVSTAQHNTSVTTPDHNTINEWLLNNNVPAIAIATIENGKLNHLLSYGNTQGGLPAKSNTIFDVASLTKTVTTLLTLKLVGNGSWDLDNPLFNYWIDPDVKNDSLHKKITTRHVLSHRTGFANWRWMHQTKKLTFEFEPGSKFQYSGEGFEYLRKALENRFDIPFEELADSLVFKPNKMNDSYLVWNEHIDSVRFAGAHDKSGNAYDYVKSFKVNAADNLLTTIEDFGNLGVNIINRQYLDQNVYDEMISQQSIVREGINFGLGWIVFNDLPNNEYALFNAGSDIGVNALIVLLPKSKRGLIVITNGDNGRALAMKTIGETLGEAGKEILGRF
ncbi:serine hydrolase domain-containing protein [Aquimarina celericrescens]|uniref:Serine hydrolase domain-containing protein n=1 Tax=Aquimarina celericrescens TaxID=1964542 RepID=A0ABW5B248_9FLAO|nr:beta-lactamase family protein [Aquimarina celericrescens]